MPLYVNGKNINIGRTSENYATSAAAILAQDPGRPSGFYWIRTTNGMASAQQIWCDMESGNATTGKGFMRFWWHGTFEQDGNVPPSYTTSDAFGTADISTGSNPTTSRYGYFRIPSQENPSYLLVKGWTNHNGRTVPSNNAFHRKLPYAIWAFDGSATANTVKASMQNGQTYNNATNNAWQPILNATRNSGFPYTNYDAWYYKDYTGSNGYKSFHLDDDTGWHYTAFGAGWHGSNAGPGVDCFSGTTGSEERAYYDLVLYWK